jgi:hypothetical protein
VKTCAIVYYDLCIAQYAVFRRTFTWTEDDGTPKDLTGYTAKLQIRKTANDPTALVTLTSTPAAGITITAAEGKIEFEILSAQTALLTIPNLVYDLLLYEPGGEAIRFAEGLVVSSPGVTK